jgi:hypothetical protein
MSERVHTDASSRSESATVSNVALAPLGAFEKTTAWDSSFPSKHAAAAWSLAAVIANRYPGWLTQLGVYGAASAVSLSRIEAGRCLLIDEKRFGRSRDELIGLLDRANIETRPVVETHAPAGALFRCAAVWRR